MKVRKSKEKREKREKGRRNHYVDGNERRKTRRGKRKEGDIRKTEGLRDRG